ncbi:MAG: M43 family zinc metalloprotease [Armatimonadota bacterium]
MFRAQHLVAACVFILLSSVFTTAAGCNPTCGTPTPAPTEMAAAEAATAPFSTSAATGQVPVVFTVYYWQPEGEAAVGNVSQAQIDAQIAELNRAFGPVGFTFVLEGVQRFNCAARIPMLSGIISKWFHMELGSVQETQAKHWATNTANNYDVLHHLMVYTCEPTPSTTLGWSYFPWWFVDEGGMWDEGNEGHGVVIRHDILPGGAFPGYGLGRTLVHELGHYFGLYHTFEGGCSEPNDLVGDTPAHLRTWRCDDPLRKLPLIVDSRC